MAEHYTDEDMQAALEASLVDSDDEESLLDTLGISEEYMTLVIVRIILDAVAPAIAARALREAAVRIPTVYLRSGSPGGWLRARADEIEGKPHA